MCSPSARHRTLGLCLRWEHAGFHATVYLAGVEEAKLVSCIVVGDVMSRRPRASCLADGRAPRARMQVKLDLITSSSWIQCYKTWLERKSGWSM